MRRGRQWDIQREVNVRIPRGSLEQNLFRAKVWWWYSRGLSFDESVRRAVASVRLNSPEFDPRLMARPERASRDVVDVARGFVLE
jgi:hypothetical protein